jgi:hypothetical protein
VKHWWRWTLRGIALLALVGSGVLVASYRVGSFSSVVVDHIPRQVVLGVVVPAETVTIRCPSAYDRAHGKTQISVVSVRPPNPSVSLFVSCNPVTEDYNDAALGLGGGAVVLAGLSFFRRRRPLSPAQMGAPVE